MIWFHLERQARYLTQLSKSSTPLPVSAQSKSKELQHTQNSYSGIFGIVSGDDQQIVCRGRREAGSVPEGGNVSRPEVLLALRQDIDVTVLCDDGVYPCEANVAVRVLPACGIHDCMSTAVSSGPSRALGNRWSTSPSTVLLLPARVFAAAIAAIRVVSSCVSSKPSRMQYIISCIRSYCIDLVLREIPWIPLWPCGTV